MRRAIESIDGFDRELGQAVLHIVLSHHGALEHGSPVVPATREATLVHAMDNLGGKLGSFDRIERELPDAARRDRNSINGLDGDMPFSARRRPEAHFSSGSSSIRTRRRPGELAHADPATVASSSSSSRHVDILGVAARSVQALPPSPRPRG